MRGSGGLTVETAAVTLSHGSFGKGKQVRVASCAPLVGKERPPVAAPMPAPVSGSRAIRLVEEEAVRRAPGRWLEKWGYTVLAPADAADAEEVATRHPTATGLLLADVAVTDRNGPGLCEIVVPRQPEMEVFDKSGYNGEAIRHYGVRHSITDYVGKPIGTDALARRLRHVLGDPGS